MEAFKDNIAAALETLHASHPAPDITSLTSAQADSKHSASALGSGEDEKEGTRGFGSALDALLRYLSGRETGSITAQMASMNTGAGFWVSGAGEGAEDEEGEGGPFVGARMFVFLSGLPDYGKGRLSGQRYTEVLSALEAVRGEGEGEGKGVRSEREKKAAVRRAQAAEAVADKGLLQPQTEFYREAAAAAVQAGICVDLFLVPGAAASREGSSSSSLPGGASPASVVAPPGGAAYCDLATLRFLSVESGGVVLLYGGVEDATLPQDLYRLLGRPSAFGGVLRVRTSKEFTAVRAYGHFFPDAQVRGREALLPLSKGEGKRGLYGGEACHLTWREVRREVRREVKEVWRCFRE